MIIFFLILKNLKLVVNVVNILNYEVFDDFVEFIFFVVIFLNFSGKLCKVFSSFWYGFFEEFNYYSFSIFFFNFYIKKDFFGNC